MNIRALLMPVLLSGGYLAVTLVALGAVDPLPGHATHADSLSALEIQVHLDRAGFSPGILDGRDGQNTATAIYWFQHREGLPTTGTPDSITRAALARTAGAVPAVVQVVLTASDVEGAHSAKSLEERLAARFHVHPEMLRRLNPGVGLNAVRTGTSLHVPNLGARPSYPIDSPDRLVVSASGNFLQMLDADGVILYHFPASLGSAFDPSLDAAFSIVSIDRDPAPGPHNVEGAVWIELSEPGYGIHGTSSPETIGTATTEGCVRLTNWDALFLASRVARGLRVEFVDRRSAIGD